MIGIPAIAVSMRQARKALHQLGHLSNVETYMSNAPAEIKIDWEYASEVRKEHPTTQMMMSALGLTEQQVDELFELAYTL